MNIINIEKLINYNFKNKELTVDDNNVSFADYILNLIIDNKIYNELFYFDNELKSIFTFEEIKALKDKLLSDEFILDRITKSKLINELDNDNLINEFKALISNIIKESNDINKIESILNLDESILLNLDSKNNYAKLVYEWSKRKYGLKPEIIINDNELIIKLNEINDEFKSANMPKLLNIFNASKLAYNYLENNNLLLKMSDIIGLPDQDRCINQLQELFAKGFINEPVYKIAMKGTNNGVDIWKCRIMIEGYKESFSAEDTSKKNAKRIVALQMLKYILDNE